MGVVDVGGPVEVAVRGAAIEGVEVRAAIRLRGVGRRVLVGTDAVVVDRIVRAQRRVGDAAERRRVRREAGKDAEGVVRQLAVVGR